MKKAIVIGATSEIGRSLARLLVDNDYKVGITGRRNKLLQEIQTAQPDRYLVKLFDTCETESVTGKLQELVNELGGLDMLILSSGTGDLNEDLDFDIEKRTIETNVSGFTVIVDWAFNYFAAQKHGHLVGISSVAGLRGDYLAPSYAASKAYQINYLEGLRIKAAKTKLPIFITDIRPGFVNTAMAKGDGLFWVAPVEKAATQIFKAVVKKRNIVYVTKRWRLMAYLLKLLPTWVMERL